MIVKSAGKLKNAFIVNRKNSIKELMIKDRYELANIVSNARSLQEREKYFKRHQYRIDLIDLWKSRSSLVG
jgi:hypothetical protein